MRRIAACLIILYTGLTEHDLNCLMVLPALDHKLWSGNFKEGDQNRPNQPQLKRSRIIRIVVAYNNNNNIASYRTTY